MMIQDAKKKKKNTLCVHIAAQIMFDKESEVFDFLCFMSYI